MLDKFYGNSETMLNCQSSQIGYGRDSYKIDRLVINSFLKKPIADEGLKLFSKKERNKEWFIDLIDELNKGGLKMIFLDFIFVLFVETLIDI